MRAIFVVLVLCVAIASPAACISRWFTAAFNDLKFTLHRYGYCLSGLQPVTSARFNETEYLVNQIKTFLDQGNYDNEQLANVSTLLDTICRTSSETYPISMHVDIKSFNSSTNPNAKSVRCRAIDDVMDSMYYVFKRAALNRSEPLDFSSIQYYPNETDRNAFYNVSDLINTSWITSEVVLEHVCSITNATKEYVQARSKRMSAKDREDPPAGLGSWFVWFFDRLLEPVLGLQKRLYWEGSNRLEFVQARLNSGLMSLRNGFGSLLTRANSTMVAKNATDHRLVGTTTRPPRLNSTRAVNGTDSAHLPLTQATVTTPLPAATTTTRAFGTNKPSTSTTVAV